MKYYIIAGEASGDLHGSNLIKELRLLDTNANIHCWGGNLMQAAGAKLVKHYRQLAFMGFIEVLLNLPAILKNFSFCKKDITQFKPDVIVFIDYPGFNLPMAKWAKRHHYKTVFYISPQVWAWKENRVKQMKLYIDHMMVILPFEKDYYKNKWNWDVEYVGHPLVKVIEDFKKENVPDVFAAKNIIALLPGSRKQEILKKLPVMLEVSKNFPEYKFVLAKAPGVEDAFYRQLLLPCKNVEAVSGKTYSILNNAAAALVTSGTATLETALFRVPETVCYKGSAISYQIAKRLIKIKFISLVNLIMNREVVKELIQDEMNVKNLGLELLILLTDNKKQTQLQLDYNELISKLSAGGNASFNAAKSIIDFLGH